MIVDFAYPRMSSLLSTILITLGISYVLILLSFYFFQMRLVYFPTQIHSFNPGHFGLDFEEVQLTTSDETKIHGWFVPSKTRGVHIIFFHGNAGNISDRMDTIRLWNQLGISGLYIDYRGYGKSEGVPSEQGTYLDAQAAWDFLVRAKGISFEKIIIHGRSLGGPIAAWLASKNQSAGLILESTFISLPELGQSLYPILPVKQLARIKYSTMKYLEETKCSVLVVHSKQDEIIPVSHGQLLAKKSGSRGHYLEIRGSHNDGFLESRQDYVPALQRFIEQIDTD